MKQGNELSWPQVVMAANAPMMTKAALVDGRTDVGVLPTGQVVGEIDELPTVAELDRPDRGRGDRGASGLRPLRDAPTRAGIARGSLSVRATRCRQRDALDQRISTSDGACYGGRRFEPQCGTPLFPRGHVRRY